MSAKIKKAVAIMITITIILIVATAVMLYMYFFQGDIVSKVPNDIKEKCEVKEEKFKGRKVFVLTPKEEKNSEQIILYLHGGSYIAELSSSHWKFLGNFVKDTKTEIIVPDYPLAPKYKYTDVFEMVTPLYKQIINKKGDKKLILMGDSAGGGMSLALMQHIAQEGLEKPNKTILISPWLDVTMENPDIKPVQENDRLLNQELLKLAGISYAGSEEATKKYLVSPIYGPIDKLENITIYTGTNDILNPDVHKLKELAKQKRNRN